jgi:predicted HTH transcriptional regulator
MDLLAQDFNTITFQDVVDFCDQKIVEGTELDYKQVIPRDLAKHFAAMSNRYGGLIIIGVEEDPRTGMPSKYEGLVNDGKLIDRIHQFANNVRPLPSYHVRTTSEVNGKVFLLVRISEGGAPPYTPKNDPTVATATANPDRARPHHLNLRDRGGTQPHSDLRPAEMWRARRDWNSQPSDP